MTPPNASKVIVDIGTMSNSSNKMDMTLVKYALMANPTIQHAVQF